MVGEALRGLDVRGFDDLTCLLSSALLLHGFGQLARRAVEDVDLGHVFEIELMDQSQTAHSDPHHIARGAMRRLQAASGSLAISAGILRS